MSEGSAARDLGWLVAILIALWLFWAFSGGPQRFEVDDGRPFLRGPGASNESRPATLRPARRSGGGQTDEETSFLPSSLVSPWREQIKLSQGNARSEDEARREYVVIENNSREQEVINITGWSLVNSPLRRSPPALATIPRAAKIFSPLWAAVSLSDIKLDPGSRVIVNTGHPPASNEWPANVAFQTNKCTGYLATEFRDFHLSPALPKTCPKPSSEVGLAGLGDDCYDFVRRYPSCQPAEFERDSEGYELLNGRRFDLNSACRQYVIDHFSYGQCLAWHQLDADFYGPDWRVYLNRTWELWADNREQISLYDNQGRLVDQISY